MKKHDRPEPELQLRTWDAECMAASHQAYCNALAAVRDGFLKRKRTKLPALWVDDDQDDGYTATLKAAVGNA